MTIPRLALAAGVCVLALAPGGCTGQRIPPFIADVPPSNYPPPPGNFPNLNEVPERNTTLRTKEEVEALERELEEARRSHVEGTERTIEGSGTGS